MSLRQRLDALEQVIQPGRFLVLELDPARDEREQIDAYHAQNGTTARDTLVILCRRLGSEEPQDQEPASAAILIPSSGPPEARRKATPCSPASMIG